MYTYYSGSPSTALTNAANAWSTTNAALTAAALPEGQPYPLVHSALEGLLDAQARGKHQVGRLGVSPHVEL